MFLYVRLFEVDALTYAYTYDVCMYVHKFVSS